MTKTYAAHQLLRLGPLNLGEFQEITGWGYRCCVNTLSRMREVGTVRLLRRERQESRYVSRSIYAVVV